MLAQTPAPIRSSLPTKEASQVLSLPKEIWRMVDHLFRNGMDEEGLFVTSGEKEEIGTTALSEWTCARVAFGLIASHSLTDWLAGCMIG